jgi:hypothetical protein
MMIVCFFVGMDSVLPNREPYVPQMGQKVSIYVGEPLIFDELVQKMKKENHSLVYLMKHLLLFWVLSFQQEIRKAVTDIIQNEFAKLKLKCEELHRQHLATGDSSSKRRWNLFVLFVFVHL